MAKESITEKMARILAKQIHMAYSAGTQSDVNQVYHQIEQLGIEAKDLLHIMSMVDDDGYAAQTWHGDDGPGLGSIVEYDYAVCQTIERILKLILIESPIR